MFIINYGNLTYFMTLIIPVVVLLILFFSFRKRSKKVQKGLILTLMFINLFQHLFKAWVWYPVYHGQFDLYNISFCNICATSIIISPFVFLSKNKYLKDALFYIGVMGGLFSMAIPYWYEGKSALEPDFIRFFTCHSILFLTSMLPILFGLHRPNIKRFWAVGIIYIAYEVLIFADTVIIYYFTKGNDWNLAYTLAYDENQFWITHRPIREDAIGRVFNMLKLESLIYDGSRSDIPILYDFYIVYIIITLGVLLVSLLFFRKEKDEKCVRYVSYYYS